MKMPYNQWFYKTHKYLQNEDSKGNKDYNDIKSINMNYRYKRLAELHSELFEQQPFGVVSNNYGFDKLISLMEASNYSFEDINESLIDTYRKSLTNAMSGMLVNTHAVMFRCSNTDKKYVTPDNFSKYYIVDTPFNQLHFGDRDEFIRQELSKMHTMKNDKYIPAAEFITSPYTKLLGFTLMCCVNGRICNDWKVAIDDKGFRFKIYWPYDYKKCEFIIYKLDCSRVYTTTTTVEDLLNGKLINVDCDDAFGEKCIVNLYDDRYGATDPAVPNFGILNKDGLKMLNIQDFTFSEFKRLNTSKVTVTAYALKYFHEVPNIYPAINYYDMVSMQKVYDKKHEKIVDIDQMTIYCSDASYQSNANELEICTPPIVLDRNINNSFMTIFNCLKIKANMLACDDAMKNIGTWAMRGDFTELTKYKNIMSELNVVFKNSYETYIRGGMLTSLVDSNRLNRFEKFLNNVNGFINDATEKDISSYIDYNIFPEIYGEFYAFVDYICEPFMNDKFLPFADVIGTNPPSYFEYNNENRFNRPVSEQCFITMKYDRIDKCWVFDVPDIKHFKGIGNSFYIENDLKGDEVYKFFVLYTDTLNPTEETLPILEHDTVLDFDKFYDEINKHMGYIKYWNVENRIMRMCDILYNKYSPDNVTNILSKILKRKMEGSLDILNQYPTEMNYEPSNASSLNWNNYDEYSAEAPLSVNFLFYTLAMLNNNDDKLQAYFYRMLLKRSHTNRYADIPMTSMIDNTSAIPTNFSALSVSPNTIDIDSSNIPDEGYYKAFYGIPLFIRDGEISDGYRYTFNICNPDIKYPMTIDNDIDDSYYLSFSNPAENGYISISYEYDLNIGKMIYKYLDMCYDAISFIQTNYMRPINIVEDISRYVNNIESFKRDLSLYITLHENDFYNPQSKIISQLVLDNSFDVKLKDISNKIDNIRRIQYNGRRRLIENVTNNLITTLTNIFKNIGFEYSNSKRVSNLYNHLKKINTTLNIYKFKKWVEDIDIELIEELDNIRSKNHNSEMLVSDFAEYGKCFKMYKESGVLDSLDELKNAIDGLFTNNYENHFKPVIEYCIDIIENWVFNYYVLDQIEYDKSIIYNEKPYMIEISAASIDPHFYPKYGPHIENSGTMLFKPCTDYTESGWIITDIAKMCEYAFFRNSDNRNRMRIYNENGEMIDSPLCTLKFIKIGTSVDQYTSFNQFPYVKNQCIDIQNVHEEYDINSENRIINKKYGKMNYELLVGNKFRQLDHTSELIIEKKTELPGPVDRIFMRGSLLNQLANKSMQSKGGATVHFKPSQIIHLPITDNVLTSIGGKYFVGQTIYLITDDTNYIFPVKISAIDMSSNKGFIEGIIDEYAEWFSIEDINQIKRYMTENIPCTVIDDNICNFLDEFNNPNYGVYQIPDYNNIGIDQYSMPGDPLYVERNAPYVYTRLNWIFDGENKYMDDQPQNHHMIYIDSTDSLEEGAPIKIKLINHVSEPFTESEKYHSLREEPDDHLVWYEEMRIFKSEYDKAIGMAKSVQNQIDAATRAWDMIPEEKKTRAAYKKYRLTIDNYARKRDSYVGKSNRVKLYLEQLETPTTWYNVRTYETSQVYIDNGRAYEDLLKITNICNIPYTNKIKVYIYDWDNRVWVNPNSYTLNLEMLDSIKINEYDDYVTNHIMNSLTISPTEDFPVSKKLLIYFAYDMSDVFDTIPINDKICDVRFKPLLTLNKSVDNYNPYLGISLRKHFDAHESYSFNEYSDIEGFDLDGYLVDRINVYGKPIESPNMRYCDISAKNGENDLSYTDFDIYINIPLKDVTTTRSGFDKPTYDATIITPIDGFIPDRNIKLICISNDNYDGNISSVMFDTHVTIDEDDNIVLTVLNSTLPDNVSGTFICTVFKDSYYPHVGGVISITVTPNPLDVVNGHWVRIIDPKYRILPRKFVLVPKESIEGEVVINIVSEYEKTSNDIINTSNDDKGPFEFYYNEKDHIKYPLGNIHTDDHATRLVIDQEINKDIKVVKTTYLSISRYVLQIIPENGIIDMTGYLPTPLSRDHYEFWVNGRCLKENVTILSPTSIQLTNLNSLRNFECIELVDDKNDSLLTEKRPVYIDINGRMYDSFIKAHNSQIYSQSIKYSFNVGNQTPLQTHVIDILPDPNNKNIEPDIMGTIIIDETLQPFSYNELYNIPSINGVKLHNVSSYQLGMVEIPTNEILKLFDEIWKEEEITNPLFPMKHIPKKISLLHSKYSASDNSFIVDCRGKIEKPFSLYISNMKDGDIDDINNTLKIIPFIRSGVLVYIDESFRGKWLCCTHPGIDSIRLI